MSIHNKVLPKDSKAAKSLVNCCESCLERARMELHLDNLDESERWIKEFQRSKRDLEILLEKKRRYDQMENLVKDLKGKGVNIELISWEGRKEIKEKSKGLG